MTAAPPAPPPGPPPGLVARPGHRVEHVEVDGLRLRVARRGTGRPLLLLMGIGGNLDMWEPLDRALDGSGIERITFDAPGTGESDSWRWPRRMPALARTVERMLDALGLDRVDVLGVSFGGAMAQQLAVQAPGRVRRLVLAATMPGLGGVPGRPSAMLTLATPLRYYSPAYFRRVAPVLYGGRVGREPALLAQQAYARFAKPPSPRGYLYQLYAVPGWTSVPWLRRIRQPTLVLAGDDDPITPVLNARILARLIPNARLHVLPGGGHLFLLEEAEESARLVTAFLAEA